MRATRADFNGVPSATVTTRPETVQERGSLSLGFAALVGDVCRKRNAAANVSTDNIRQNHISIGDVFCSFVAKVASNRQALVNHLGLDDKRSAPNLRLDENANKKERCEPLVELVLLPQAHSFILKSC